MSLTAALVLASALLHALWNTAAKSVGDRWVSSALMGCGYLVAGLVTVLLRPAPDPASWQFLIASAALQVVYLLLLTSAYQHGDMNRLYPLIRGLDPLLVSIVALTVLGEQISGWALFGIGMLLAGLAVLALGRGLPRRGEGIGLAVLTGCCIAAYSLVDGIGVRHSGEAIGYAGWMFLIQAPLLIITARLRGGHELLPRMRPHAVKGFVGGLLSFLTYGIVVWAQNRMPLSVVAALRETGVVWAVLLGTVLLRERLSRRGVFAAGLALAGAMLVDLT